MLRQIAEHVAAVAPEVSHAAQLGPETGKCPLLAQSGPDYFLPKARMLLADALSILND